MSENEKRRPDGVQGGGKEREGEALKFPQPIPDAAHIQCLEEARAQFLAACPADMAEKQVPPEEQASERQFRFLSAEDVLALTGRYLTPDTARACGIGWNPADRYERRDAWGLSPVEGREKLLLPRGLVIESSMEDVARHRYQSQMTPQSLLQTLAAWSIRYGLHVHWCGNRAGGEYMVFSLLQKYLREQETRLEALVKAHGEGDAA